MIWQEGEGFLIKDLNSQNGTWVDGQRTQGTKLEHDVCIVAGRTVFMFCEHPHAVGTVAKPQTVAFGAAAVLPAALAGRTAPAPAQSISSPARTDA